MGRLSESLLGGQPFAGVTYVPSRDCKRLSGQLLAVNQVMQDRQWHTLADLAQRAGASEAGVSARLRDLRKPQFGGCTIEREHMKHGLWRYRLLDNVP